MEYLNMSLLQIYYWVRQWKKQLGQLSLASLRGGLIEYQLSLPRYVLVDLGGLDMWSCFC